MVVLINHIDNTATQIRNWDAPDRDGGVSARSQGNLQVLHNGNVFIGWGDHPFYSEHLDSGEPVMYGKLAHWGSGVMMYRCNKYNWTAEPTSHPSLWTYSRTGTNGMVFYVSWNGATEMKGWAVYTSDSASGPFEKIMAVQKQGFETKIPIRDVKLWSFVEALDAHGRPLRRSSITKTFIPSEALLPSCDDNGCNTIPPLAEDQSIDHKTPHVEQGTYSTGYNTAAYYLPIVQEATKLELKKIGFPVGLGFFALLVLLTLFNRRRAQKAFSCCQESLQQSMGLGMRRKYAKLADAEMTL